MCNRGLQRLRRFDTRSKTAAADKILPCLRFGVQTITGNTLHFALRPFDRHAVSPAQGSGIRPNKVQCGINSLCRQFGRCSTPDSPNLIDTLAAQGTKADRLIPI